MTEKSKNRIWELDFIRGIAIICMIFIHLNYVLIEFYNLNILASVPNFENIIYVFMDYGGIVFILISGICSCFSRDNLKRGLSLFFVAMLISYGTFIFEKYLYSGSRSVILFGVLHCLAVSMIAGHFLLKFLSDKKYANIVYLALSVLIIALGYILRAQKLSFPILNGFASRSFPSSDYFPLLPYMGWFILGIFIGKIFYSKGHAIFKSEKAGEFPLIKAFSFVGKHSLIFYIAHQPVIFGILFILKTMKIL